MTDVTQLIQAVQRGEVQAANDLMPLVYEELRRLAAQRLRQEAPGHVLQPTALVHEAYIRLVGAGDRDRWAGRRHFFGAAAEAMRRILVESARQRQTLKRGGDAARVDIPDAHVLAPHHPKEIIDVSEALRELAGVDPMAAELVKLRYFAGLTLQESAAVLDLSPRSADRLWAYARAWLHQELCPE